MAVSYLQFMLCHGDVVEVQDARVHPVSEDEKDQGFIHVRFGTRDAQVTLTGTPAEITAVLQTIIAEVGDLVADQAREATSVAKRGIADARAALAGKDV